MKRLIGTQLGTPSVVTKCQKSNKFHDNNATLSNKETRTIKPPCIEKRKMGGRKVHLFCCCMTPRADIKCFSEATEAEGVIFPVEVVDCQTDSKLCVESNVRKYVQARLQPF